MSLNKRSRKSFRRSIEAILSATDSDSKTNIVYGNIWQIAQTMNSYSLENWEYFFKKNNNLRSLLSDFSNKYTLEEIENGKKIYEKLVIEVPLPSPSNPNYGLYLEAAMHNEFKLVKRVFEENGKV